MANTIEYRQNLKRNTPQVWVSRKHTEQCVTLPDRMHLLEALPKNGIVAEVGVAFGDYTAEIIKRNEPIKLHLVDSWDSDRYREGLERILGQYDDLIESGKLIINQGNSTKMLPEFPDGYFDWVYIDTNHSYSTTYNELMICKSKVKPAGLIAGHDFCPGNVITPWPYGVIEACNKFCVEEGWQYRFLTVEPHGHQSFALSRL
jgi:hypothetical protein